jgi:alkylation response protein AidB-like acyl-CoA dehydrogenase
MPAPSRLGFDETHEMFRQGFRTFLERHVVPNREKWEQAGIVDKALFREAGAAGFLAFDAPEPYGSAITDFRYNAIVIEEAAQLGVLTEIIGMTLHNDVCLPYFLSATNDEQKARWLPGICDGSLITAVAMTEPTMGSDLAAMRTTAVLDGDQYVINGSKTFITNAFNADIVIVACKTDPTQRHRGMSLIVVEADTPGFERGRNLDKIGQHSADTGELFFNDVRVPAANLLGAAGEGFAHLVTKLPRERLSIAVAAVAQAEAAFDLGLSYAKERQAFGQPIGSFQHNRFALAEMRTEIDIAQVFVDHQLDALNKRELSAETAAEAKWWTTELCKRVVDTCLQLHGGYGYMEEYPIARLYRDVRIMTIYGGTTEIMKEIIGRGLGV